VRAAPKRKMAVDWEGLVGGGGAMAAVRNVPGATMMLASEADGPSQGWTGEAATCSGTGQRSGEENGTAADTFERARARGDEGKRRGRGGRVGAAWGQDRSGEGGAEVWCRVSRHDTSAAAPGHSDSGGWRTSRGRDCDTRGDGRERREAQRLTVRRDDAGARWAAAGCGRARRHGAVLTRGPGSTMPPDSVLNRIKFISNGFKFAPNFDRSKRCFPLLQKLEIKYGWKEFKIRNNLSYRNLSRFELKFE
jgi:hypothetical protein